MRWLRAHGVLLVVYGAGLVLAVLELAHPEVRVGKLEQPEAYLAPDVNVADVSAAIYPDRALTLYYQAYQASLCQGRADDPATVCSRRGPPRPGEVRQLIERSLATGNQSIELALYNYAVVLIHENAPAEEIEAAVRAWRLAYPASEHPDPRIAFRRQAAGANRQP
jgi:hypothetical protein